PHARRQDDRLAHGGLILGAAEGEVKQEEDERKVDDSLHLPERVREIHAAAEDPPALEDEGTEDGHGAEEPHGAGGLDEAVSVDGRASHAAVERDEEEEDEEEIHPREDERLHRDREVPVAEEKRSHGSQRRLPQPRGGVVAGVLQRQPQKEED